MAGESFPPHPNHKPIFLGIIVIGLAVVFWLIPQVFQKPPAVIVPEAEAIRRAEALLLELRPAAHPAVPLTQYATSHTQVCSTSTGESEWQFGYYHKPEKLLYQIYLNVDGQFHGFRTFHLVPPPEKPAPPLDPETAIAQAQALVAKLDLSRTLSAKPPELDVVGSQSGYTRRTVRWDTNQSGADGRVKSLLVAFEGTQLQAVEFKGTDREPQGFTKRMLIVLTGLVVMLGAFLLTVFTFFKDLGRREIGSKAAVTIGAVILAVIWLLPLLIRMVLSWSELVQTRIKYHGFLETPLLATPDSPLPFPFWMILILVILVAGAGFIILLLPMSLLFSAVEANDWVTQTGFLTDIMRVIRLRQLDWQRIREIYLVGFGFGIVLLLINTLTARFDPGTGDWMGLLGVSRYAAVGLFSPLNVCAPLLFWQIFCGIWLLPFLSSVLRIRNHQPLAALVVSSLGLLGCCLVTNPSLVSGIGVTLLIGLTVAALLRFGWLTTAFGWLVPFSIFPVLWALRFPGSLQPALFAGLLALALPGLLSLVHPLIPRTGKMEEFEIAPPHVREKYQHERRKQELDIRWSIHQNLIPASGLMLREASIAVEYFHMPEHGRELFAFVPLSPMRLGIAIGEVSGHGMEATMLLAVTLTTLKSKAFRYPESASQTVAKINTFLSPRLKQTNATVQLVYGIADFEHHTFSFCNAGYIPPLLLKTKLEATKSPLRQLRAQPSLGDTEASEFHENVWKAAPGDTLVLNSDWLWDLFDPASHPFPLEEKLCDHIQPLQHLSPKEIVREIIAEGKALQEGQGKPPIEITALCVRF